MKRDRVAEIHFYEWRIGAWAISETRDRLDAAGRGIYRELLDQCYGQGKIPDDAEWICRRCACTQEQYERTWKTISRHFPKIEGTEYRYNVHADIVRGEYFSYVERQRANRKCRVDKPIETNDIINDGSTMSGNVSNGGSTNGNGNGNTTATTSNPQTPAPVGACPDDCIPSVKAVLPLVRKPRNGNRTTEQIRAALGTERLKWWEAFWEVFPCRDGMNKGMDAFEVRVHDHNLAVEIYKAAKSYRAKCESDPSIKVKFPQGWINSERWLDENNLPAIVPRPQQKSFLSDVEQVMSRNVKEKGTPW